jgi:hypothetical protein
MRSLLMAAAAWLLIQPASAAETTQSLSYDIVVNGAVVGSRDVSIRYLEPFTPGDAESRVIETWTELEARVGGWRAEVQNRSTGHITRSDSSFTSSLSLNGDVSEVQGRTLADGRWQLHGIFNRRLSNWELRRTEVDLSTLDLLDPIRSQQLTTLTQARVLSAETGQVMTGPVADLGEGVLIVGGQEVRVHRWSWTPQEGRFELAWSSDGMLLGWSAEIKGQTIQGRLKALPEPRSFGVAPALTGLPEFVEEEL